MKKILPLLLLLLLAVAGVHAQAPAILQLKFAAYDAKSDGSYRLQVNGLDVRIPSVKLPQQDYAIRGTNYKVAEFNLKHWRSSGTFVQLVDISELVLVHVKTGRRVTLVLGKTVELSAPDAPLPLSR